jgi:methyl-accepting chemotaxis protein
VVAGEVRTLAQKSSTAAREIGQLIQDSVAAVRAGTAQASRAGAAIEELAGRVGEVGRMIEQIAVASAEQAIGIDQVNHAVASVDRATQENAALVEALSTSSTMLRGQSQRVGGSLQSFVLEDAHASRDTHAVAA